MMKIMLTRIQVLDVYKQLMPQFSDFLGQLQPRDQQSLKTNYAI